MKVIATKIVRWNKEEEITPINIYSSEFMYKVQSIMYDRYSNLALVIFNSVNDNNTNDCIVYKCE